MVTAPRGRKTRILFVDYWTKGIRRYCQIAAGSDPDAAEFILFHYGSFYESGVPRMELLDGLPCVDIAAFEGMDLAGILRSLNPDVVVAPKMAGLYDRALFLTSQRLGIPTAFLQHGSWTDRDVLRPILEELDRGFTWMDRIRRIPRVLRVLPWYLRARGKPLADPGAWRVVWKLARTPSVSYFFPIFPEELWPAAALVYNSASAETLVSSFRLPRENIQIVGNPELDSVVARRDDPISAKQRIHLRLGLGFDPARPVVCYLEDGFVEQQKCFGWDEDRRVRSMQELYQTCVSAKVQLLIRPHPLTDLQPMQEALAGRAGVAVSRSLPLVDTLDIADGVVGTISTALETAIVFRKPIIIAEWHINGQVEFAPCLRYEAARAASSPDELAQLLRQLARGELSAEDSDRFVKARLGPLDGKSVKRIAAALLSLARPR